MLIDSCSVYRGFQKMLWLPSLLQLLVTRAGGWCPLRCAMWSAQGKGCNLLWSQSTSRDQGVSVEGFHIFGPCNWSRSGIDGTACSAGWWPSAWGWSDVSSSWTKTCELRHCSESSEASWTLRLHLYKNEMRKELFPWPWGKMSSLPFLTNCSCP